MSYSFFDYPCVRAVTNHWMNCCPRTKTKMNWSIQNTYVFSDVYVCSPSPSSFSSIVCRHVSKSDDEISFFGWSTDDGEMIHLTIVFDGGAIARPDVIDDHPNADRADTPVARPSAEWNDDPNGGRTDKPSDSRKQLMIQSCLIVERATEPVPPAVDLWRSTESFANRFGGRIGGLFDDPNGGQ